MAELTCPAEILPPSKARSATLPSALGRCCRCGRRDVRAPVQVRAKEFRGQQRQKHCWSLPPLPLSSKVCANYPVYIEQRVSVGAKRSREWARVTHKMLAQSTGTLAPRGLLLRQLVEDTFDGPLVFSAA